MKYLRGMATALGAAVILLAGGGLLLWRGDVADRALRDDLLLQARLLAHAVDPAAIRALTASPADLESPVYQRLKEQLTLARGLDDRCRFLYLLGRGPTGSCFFLLDSEPTDSDDYSPPGQPYPEATPDLHSVFDTGSELAEGPVVDRWGTWVSALVPVQDPRSGTVVAVLGMDVEARNWRGLVWRSLLPLLGGLVVVALLALGGRVLLRQRRWLPPEQQAGWRRHLETGLATAIGLMVTLLLGHSAAEHERRSQWVAFCRLGASLVDVVRDAITDVRDVQLEGLARLFEASDFVDRAEFDAYAGFLTRDAFAQSWEWVPAVPATNTAGFTRAVRGGGAPTYTLWQPDGAGGRGALADGRPVYYPVCYIAPLAGNEGALGFDLSADVTRRRAMETATETRLMTASDPVALATPAGGQGVQVFRAVHSHLFPGRLDGFVAVTMRMDLLLRTTIQPLVSGAPIALSLRQLRTGLPALELAATAGPGVVEHGPALAAPLFAFGKCYVIFCQPAVRFPPLQALRAAAWAVVGGLLATALVASVLAFQRFRQTTLEDQVRARTRELEESERLLAEAEHMAGIGSWELDLRSRQMTWSREIYRLLDLDPAVVRPAYPLYRDAIHPDDRAGVDAAYAASVRDRRPYDIAHRLQLSDGRIKFVRERCETFLDADGEPRRSVGTVQDITDLRQADAERSHLQAQLLHAHKMESIGRLAGGVAHDFNNMLQAIMGNAALARAEAAPGSALHDYVDEISRSAERAAALTRQLLAFASRQTASPRIIDLNDTISGLLRMLRRLIGEAVQLSWEPGADLWPVRVDPSQVDQILANLAVNARDAMGGAGRITIETRNRRCDASCRHDFPGCLEGEFVQLSVSDNGPGMDARTREYIFEPFFTTKPQGQGTGLGLATVFGIVRQNGGFIEVDTAPGQGARFRILLPRSEPPPAAGPAPAGPPPAAPRSGRERLLIVEDEAAILKLSQSALERLGYTVLTAATPAEALARARASTEVIHLLITDVVLPEMNGRELAEQLRALRPGLRCLYISGYTADVIAEQGVLDATLDFIQKPFTIDQLTDKVREVLERPGHG